MVSNAQASAVRVPELLDNILRQITMEIVHTQGDDEDEPDILQPAPEIIFDLASLKSCSLVSKMWRDLAVRYLFHTFSAEFGWRRSSTTHDLTTPLLEFLDAVPHVRDAIRELRLKVTAKAVAGGRSCREGFNRIITMLPRIRVLHISRALHMIIGTPEALSVPLARFPQTLQQLTLDGMHREYERDEAGILQPASLTLGWCSLRGVWSLVSQFDVVEDLVINRVFLQNPERKDPQRQARPHCDLRCITLRMVDLKQASLKDLCFPSTKSLHLHSAAVVGKLRKTMQAVPGDVASNIRELSIWKSETSPSQDTTMDFEPFVNLSRLCVIVSNEWCDEDNAPWRDAEGLLSCFLASGQTVDKLDLKLTSVISGGGPGPAVLPEGSFAQFEGDRMFEDLLLRIVRSGRAPCVHIGLYSWDPFYDFEMRFVPDITGKIAAAFPQLDRLGFLRLKTLDD